MDSSQRPGVALTTFDQRTARAVVAVLQHQGLDAWAETGTTEDTPVIVAEGQRDRAWRILNDRMEDVRQSVAEDTERAQSKAPTTSDPDDVHDGPPLVMERFRNFAWVAAVLLVPLMAVTLAPTIRGRTAIWVAIGVATVVFGILAFRRRR